MIVYRVQKILIEKGILTTTMTTMNPLSDQFLAVTHIFPEHYRILSQRWHPPARTTSHHVSMGPAAPFVSLSPLVGSRSSGTTMRTAALRVTLYVLRQLIIFSPHNYHPCRFIWFFGPHASFSSSLFLFLPF